MDLHLIFSQSFISPGLLDYHIPRFQWVHSLEKKEKLYCFLCPHWMFLAQFWWLKFDFFLQSINIASPIVNFILYRINSGSLHLGPEIFDRQLTINGVKRHEDTLNFKLRSSKTKLNVEYSSSTQANFEMFSCSISNEPAIRSRQFSFSTHNWGSFSLRPRLWIYIL